MTAIAALRVQSCVREVDTVTPVGPASMAVLLDVDVDRGAAPVIADEIGNRIAVAFATPIVVGDRSLRVDASVSLTDADTGLGMGVLDGNALSLRYQPLIALQNEQIVGLEALLRCGDQRPNRFIPMAEQSGLIVPVGQWVLRTALNQRGAWTRDIPGLPALGLSVNLSARQLTRPGLTNSVREALDEAGLEPDILLLELTETALVSDEPTMRSELASLSELGVRIALDDFGTGWASLEYLTRLPVDALKIAQVFIEGLGVDDRGTALVQAIVDLAHSMGLITIAEGVETREQADRLRAMGCFLAQGWYFGRELSVEDATTTLQALP